MLRLYLMVPRQRHHRIATARPLESGLVKRQIQQAICCVITINLDRSHEQCLASSQLTRLAVARISIEPNVRKATSTLRMPNAACRVERMLDEEADTHCAVRFIRSATFRSVRLDWWTRFDSSCIWNAAPVRIEMSLVRFLCDSSARPLTGRLFSGSTEFRDGIPRCSLMTGEWAFPRVLSWNFDPFSVNLEITPTTVVWRDRWAMMRHRDKWEREWWFVIAHPLRGLDFWTSSCQLNVRYQIILRSSQSYFKHRHYHFTVSLSKFVKTYIGCCLVGIEAVRRW